MLCRVKTEPALSSASAAAEASSPVAVKREPDDSGSSGSTAADDDDVAPACKRAKAEPSPPPPLPAAADEEEGPALDAQQRRVLALCLTGRNVFFSGIGGTGKTFLLQRITTALRAKLGDDNNRVAVVAPTGVAAVICGGQTLHSFAGCGVPLVVSDFDKCSKQRPVWQGLTTLIVDEVSMIEPAYLDWLDAAVRRLRGTPNRAFGGIQLIFCGDFGQLPGICKGVSLRGECPVVVVGGAATRAKFGPSQIPAHVDQFEGFVFQTVCWRDAAFAYGELTTVFRQSEVAMVSALTKIRRGQLDPEVVAFIAECTRRRTADADAIQPTLLYARNKDVDAENATKLAALAGPLVTFTAIDSVQSEPGAPSWARERMRGDAFFQSALVPDRVRLKVGAQVMMTKNMAEEGLVNGSRGVVLRFVDRTQTIESLTAACAKLSLASTSTSKDSARQLAAKAQLEAARSAPADATYPMVLFCNGKELLCYPMLFTHRVYMAGECQRIQVPLRLAWALTMHKSQGATLDRVKVDLHGCFSVGQCYVALSRAKTTAGLQITGFTPATVKTHPLAIAFHDALTAGTVDAFLQAVPLWFEPVLQTSGIDPNWRALFESSPTFRGWVAAAAKRRASSTSSAAVSEEVEVKKE
jgi:ATP-dependent DNA helicase PIF1